MQLGTRVIVLSVLLLSCCVVQLAAGIPYVTATYTPVPLGYRLDFVVHNTHSEGFVASFQIDAPADAGLESPAGWQGFAWRDTPPWPSYTDWWYTAPEYTIPPGNSLGGFSGEFVNLPPQVSYSLGLLYSVPGVYYGTVVPVPIPEPSALTAVAAGLAMLGGLRLKRRRR